MKIIFPITNIHLDFIVGNSAVVFSQLFKLKQHKRHQHCCISQCIGFFSLIFNIIVYQMIHSLC